MSDDGGDPQYRYRPEKTTVSDRRLSVRMPSGKVYGPYKRSEVLSFIQSKRLRGEEEILFEGQSIWQPIGSDPEFFDALHAILSGRKLARSKNDGEVAEKSRPGTAVVHHSDEEGLAAHTDFSPSETEVVGSQTEVTKTVDEQGTDSGVTKNTEIEKIDPRNPWTPKHAVRPVPGTLPSPSESLPRTKKLIRKKSNPALWVSLVAALTLTLVYFSDEKKSLKGSGSTGPSLRYFRILDDSISTWKSRQIPPMPMELREASGPIMAGGNALSWIQSLQRALDPSENGEKRGTKSFWLQLAWDLAGLGSVLQVKDIKSGEEYLKQSNRILADLEAKAKLSAEEKELFKAFEKFREGALDEALRVAEPLQIDAARWIFEQASWVQHWQSAQKSKYFGTVNTFSELPLDRESRVRRAYALRDQSIGQAMELLAEDNPFSETLWFTSAQLLWKNQKEAGVGAASQTFVAGLQVLSLYPAIVQVNFWSEYVKFLESYSQKRTLDSARTNIAILANGDLNAKVNRLRWWDLGSEGIDPAAFSGTIVERSKQADLGPRDLAALKVFGRVLADGNKLLAIVVTDLLFRRRFDEAEAVVDQMLLRNATDAAALGALVWLRAEQYRFGEALELLEKLQKISPTEAAKNRIALFVIAREDSAADTLIDEVLAARPQESWAQYWRAKLKESKGEPRACMVAANLARLQDGGALGRAAEVLYYRCQITGRIQLSSLAKELESILQRRSTDHRFKVLYADTLVATDLESQAIRFLEDTVSQSGAHPEVLLAMGRAIEKSGEFDRARKAYELIAYRRSNDNRGLVEIARLLEAAGKQLEAARTYQAAAAVDRQSPGIFLKAARAFDKAGKPKDAARMYAQEIEMRPSVLSAFVEASTFLLKNNAPQEVPELYRKFKGGGFEQDPRALLRLAQAYFAMGEFENARIQASHALANDPKNAEIYLILAQSLEKLGEYPTARSYYLRYLALNPGANDAGRIQSKISQPPFSTD